MIAAGIAAGTAVAVLMLAVLALSIRTWRATHRAPRRYVDPPTLPQLPVGCKFNTNPDIR